MFVTAGSFIRCPETDHSPPILHLIPSPSIQASLNFFKWKVLSSAIESQANRVCALSQGCIRMPSFWWCDSHMTSCNCLHSDQSGVNNAGGLRSRLSPSGVPASCIRNHTQKHRQGGGALTRGIDKREPFLSLQVCIQAYTDGGKDGTCREAAGRGR